MCLERVLKLKSLMVFIRRSRYYGLYHIGKTYRLDIVFMWCTSKKIYVMLYLAHYWIYQIRQRIIWKFVETWKIWRFDRNCGQLWKKGQNKQKSCLLICLLLATHYPKWRNKFSLSVWIELRSLQDTLQTFELDCFLGRL